MTSKAFLRTRGRGRAPLWMLNTAIYEEEGAKSLHVDTLKLTCILIR